MAHWLLGVLTDSSEKGLEKPVCHLTWPPTSKVPRVLCPVMQIILRMCPGVEISRSLLLQQGTDVDDPTNEDA